MKRTPEEKLLNPRPGSKIAAAREFGIDLTLLVENLRLTPEQRLRKLENAVRGFELILNSLTSNHVEFIIVGEIASHYYGWKTIPVKLEICYSGKPENLDKITHALKNISPRLRAFPVDSSLDFDISFFNNEKNLKLITDAGALDLVEDVEGIGIYEDVLKESEITESFGLKTRILSIEDLIKAKRAAGRTKDLLVLPELEALQEALSDED